MALLLGVFIPAHAAVVEELVVVVKRTPTETPARTATTKAERLDDIYERWWNFPGQVLLDSPSGPVPLLGMDTVYDQHGHPVPRLPDPFTYAVITNPTDPVAMQRYLDWKRAVIRRTRIAMNKVPDTAYELGYLTPEVVAVRAGRPNDQKLVGDLRAIAPESIGRPLMTDGQARELGLPAGEVPKLPGEVNPAGIEVYWFWHQRCAFCQQMARTWFAFQRQVVAAGYKAMSINVSPVGDTQAIQDASMEVAATLEIWAVPWGEDVEYSSNTLDWLGTAKAFNITGTPTVLLVNRQTMAVHQLAGPQDDRSLREALASIAGWPEGTWPPPRAGSPAAVAPAAAEQAPQVTTPIGGSR